MGNIYVRIEKGQSFASASKMVMFICGRDVSRPYVCGAGVGCWVHAESTGCNVDCAAAEATDAFVADFVLRDEAVLRSRARRRNSRAR